MQTTEEQYNSIQIMCSWNDIFLFKYIIIKEICFLNYNNHYRKYCIRKANNDLIKTNAQTKYK